LGAYLRGPEPMLTEEAEAAARKLLNLLETAAVILIYANL
jgi:hypothetical protein